MEPSCLDDSSTLVNNYNPKNTLPVDQNYTIIRNWLNRSSNHELTLSVNKGRKWYFARKNLAKIQFFERVVEDISQHTHHVHSFECDLPASLIYKSHISGMKNLKFLQVHAVRQVPENNSSGNDYFDLRGQGRISLGEETNTSNITLLSVCLCAIDPQYILSCTSVRQLDLSQTNISQPQALHIIKTLPQLSIVDLYINLDHQMAQYPENPENEFNISLVQTSLEATSLTRFPLENLCALRLAWSFSGDLSGILDNISAPNLRELVIQGSPFVGLENPWFSMLEFLKCSGSHLEALSLGDFGVKNCLLSSCLQATPEIKHLTLHQGKLQVQDLRAMMYNEQNSSL